MTGRDNRIEVVSVVQRHQQRSWAEKARIVSEAEAAGSSFVAAATRHGVQPAQIYTWRKRLREKAAGTMPAKLVAVRIASDKDGDDEPSLESTPLQGSPGVVEVRISDKITVRISGVVPVATLAAVFSALKGV